VVWGKHALGHILYLGGSDDVDLSQNGVNVTLFPVMQEILGKIESILFTIVTGYGELPLQLAFGSTKLSLRKWMLHHTV
jgi:hypothetical protein